MHYTYQIPDNEEFRNALSVNLPKIAKLLKKTAVGFEDKGNAYYYDGKRHEWDKHALQIRFGGDEETIETLRTYNQKELISKCEVLLPPNSGFDVVLEYIITSEDISGFQSIPDALDEKIKTISTRGAEFDKMETDEQLAELNNLIENLLKQDGKYIELDYHPVFFGFLSENDIKIFRTKTQCFRHASVEMLAKRKNMSEAEKALLSDLGVFICVHLHKWLSGNGETNTFVL